LAPHGDPPIHWDEATNIRWKVAVPGEGHATPIVWGDRVFVLAAVKTDREVASLDPPKTDDLATGEVIWECGGLTTNVIPCPVGFDDLVICMSGHGENEVRAIRLDSHGDVTDNPKQVVWQSHNHAPYVPSPLVYGRHLFLTKSNLAILKVLDPVSGEPLLESVRLPEMKSIYASPVGAAGRVYIVSREGVTLVIKNQPTLDVLGINKLAEGIDASPAIVGRELFLRGQHHLYKIEAD
jgi:hypothetical protein